MVRKYLLREVIYRATFVYSSFTDTMRDDGVVKFARYKEHVDPFDLVTGRYIWTLELALFIPLLNGIEYDYSHV